MYCQRGVAGEIRDHQGVTARVVLETAPTLNSSSPVFVVVSIRSRGIVLTIVLTVATTARRSRTGRQGSTTSNGVYL